MLGEFFDLVLTEMLVYHRRFDDRRDDYRLLEPRASRARRAAGDDGRGIRRRPGAAGRRTPPRWCDWLAEHRIDALVEPTIPIVAPARGSGYDEPFGDLDDLSLTHYWDWTGFPVVALPSGVGKRSGLPTSVSLVGAPGADWDLLAWGTALQAELGTVSP